MTSAALRDEGAVESALDDLIRKLGRAKRTTETRKALIEARRLKTITQKWPAIPPQPDAKRELIARLEELVASVDPNLEEEATPGTPDSGGAGTSSISSPGISSPGISSPGISSPSISQAPESAAKVAQSGAHAIKPKSSDKPKISDMPPTEAAPFRVLEPRVSDPSIPAVLDPAQFDGEAPRSAPRWVRAAPPSASLPAENAAFAMTMPAMAAVSERPAGLAATMPAMAAVSGGALRPVEAEAKRTSKPDLSTTMPSAAPASARSSIHDEDTAPAASKTPVPPTPRSSVHEEKTAPELKFSLGGLKLDRDKSVHEEKTAPSMQFSGIHDETTAPGKIGFDEADEDTASIKPRVVLDEPTSPSPGAAIRDEDTAAHGSRAKQRRAHVRGKSVAAMRSPVAGLTIASAFAGEWTPSLPGASFRVLSREPAGRVVALVKLAPRVNLSPSAYTEQAELTILTGTAWVSGSQIDAGETCTVAAGTPRPTLASQEGCVLLFAGSNQDESVTAK